jgi:hypothetical protein
MGQMTDDEPMTLDDACREFPQARLTPYTLRAEAGRGRLDIFRLGRRDYTTRASMREMVRKCQDAARLRASTSTESATSGLSETDRVSSAQAALSQTVAALKSGSPRTLVKSTNRRVGQTH